MSEEPEEGSEPTSGPAVIRLIFACAWCDAPVPVGFGYLAWDWWVCGPCFRELQA